MFDQGINYVTKSYLHISNCQDSINLRIGTTDELLNVNSGTIIDVVQRSPCSESLQRHQNLNIGRNYVRKNDTHKRGKVLTEGIRVTSESMQHHWISDQGSELNSLNNTTGICCIAKPGKNLLKGSRTNKVCYCRLGEIWEDSYHWWCQTTHQLHNCVFKAHGIL